MSYVVIARRWRPQRFEELVGQEHVSVTLRNAIKNNRIGHAYLFVGPRGVGKTSTARILAKALNCEKGPTPVPCGECPVCTNIADGASLDVVEIDAASNNSVDDVRSLQEHISLAPMGGRYRIYIIDEVHMLSKPAFNAFLKTLEEPPAHAIFVLATTEVHKIPPTIISRCQRFDFRPIAGPNIIKRLQQICEAEEVPTEDEALAMIARAGAGSMRDAQTLLEEVITFSPERIVEQSVVEVLGTAPRSTLIEMLNAVAQGHGKNAVEIIDRLAQDGKDLGQVTSDLMNLVRDVLIIRIGGEVVSLSGAGDHEKGVLQGIGQHFEPTDLIALIEDLSWLTSSFRNLLSGRIALESLLVKTAQMRGEVSIEKVIRKIASIEDHLRQSAGSGSPPGAGAGSPQEDLFGGSAKSVSEPTPPPIPKPVERASTPESSSQMVVREEPPKQAEKPPSGKPTKETVWKRTLELIEEEKSLLHPPLSGAVPVELTEKSIEIEFQGMNGWIRSCLEKRENLAVIEKCLSEAAEKPLKLSWHEGTPPPEEPVELVEEEAPETDALPSVQEPEPAPSSADLREALNDPVVQKAISLFKGIIVTQ